MKTKAIEKIETRMESAEDPIRYEVLKAARDFKSSWIELGRALFTVKRDKLFKKWGYLNFEAYCMKEIGVRQNTAVKLLRSYYFLEKEEPEYIRHERIEGKEPLSVPSLEAVNLLRLAKKNKNLGEDDYYGLKEKLLEENRDVSEVKKDFTYILRAHKHISPEQESEKKLKSSLKRMVGIFKSVYNDLSKSAILPKGLVEDIRDIIDRLQENL